MAKKELLFILKKRYCEEYHRWNEASQKIDDKNGLLRRTLVALLTMTITMVFATTAYCNEQWARYLSEDALNMTWRYLNEQLESKQIYGEDLTTQAKSVSSSSLLIFVSHSMPISLLQTYAEEAAKYNGTLVFKGLPAGSFQLLNQLVIRIEEKAQVAMQIDEESFDKFNVKNVPTIVLKHEANTCVPWQSCKTTFDKIVGNIGIKTALEKFKEEGSLRTEAASILERSSLRGTQ